MMEGPRNEGEHKRQKSWKVLGSGLCQDKKLLEFITATVLDGRHPAYKEAKIALSPEHPDVDIQLPALVLPTFPRIYEEQFAAFRSHGLKPLPGHRHRSPKQAEPASQLDNVSSDANAFYFPVSSKERLKLAQLSELLAPTLSRPADHTHETEDKGAKDTDHEQNGLERSRSLTESHASHSNMLLRAKPGKYMAERLRFIRENRQYQAGLTEQLQSHLTHSEP